MHAQHVDQLQPEPAVLFVDLDLQYIFIVQMFSAYNYVKEKFTGCLYMYAVHTHTSHNRT